MNMIAKPLRSPTQIETGHRLAEIAAELAGYDLEGLRDAPGRSDSAKAALYRTFVQRGFAAVDALAPAVVSYETETGDKVPEEVWKATDGSGDHAVKVVRT